MTMMVLLSPSTTSAMRRPRDGTPVRCPIAAPPPEPAACAGVGPAIPPSLFVPPGAPGVAPPPVGALPVPPAPPAAPPPPPAHIQRRALLQAAMKQQADPFWRNVPDRSQLIRALRDGARTDA